MATNSNVEFFQHPQDYNLNETLEEDKFCPVHTVYCDGYEEDCRYEDGFYYWYCFPGCLPDSEPIGPFETLEKAQEDYDNENWED